MPRCADAVKVHIQVESIRPDPAAALASLSDIIYPGLSENKVHCHNVRRVALRICLSEQCDQFSGFFLACRLLHDSDAFLR